MNQDEYRERSMANLLEMMMAHQLCAIAKTPMEQKSALRRLNECLEISKALQEQARPLIQSAHRQAAYLQAMTPPTRWERLKAWLWWLP